MKNELTPAQNEVMKAIEGLYAETGVGPSYGMVSRKISRNKGYVHNMVKILKRENRVRLTRAEDSFRIFIVPTE